MIAKDAPGQTGTSADAEFNVLQTNGIDYGYLASANLDQRSSLEQKG